MDPVPYLVRRIWAIFLILQSQIICIRGDCGPPPVIEHTQPVAGTSGVPGDTVDYLCDRSTGYYEIPNKSRTITCQEDNMWSTVAEFCARACGSPERLPFAVPKNTDLDIFLPGTTVTYDCRLGYKRVPRSNNVITCLDNYTWSTPSEFCELRSCGHPQDTENGDFEATNSFFFGSRVTYKCNDGYRLTSRRNYRDCQADGTWSNAVPECEVVLCPAPDSPAEGTYNPLKEEYTYQEAVTFTCNRGLHIRGESTVSCIGNGTWSSSSPTCIAVNCADPGPIQNGMKTSGFVGPYTLNSAVSYSCEGNFVMNGSSTISCTVNNRWEPEIPKCLTVCDTPPNPPYAVLEERFTNIDYFDKTTVLYTCKTGYTRDPNKINEITCLGRSWSELAKFCSPISCGDPGDVPNARRSVSDFTFGSIITYTCKDGYTMTSINYKECLADGTWSPNEIICSAACQFPRVDNARITSDMKNVYVKNDILMFKCNKDFVLNGSRAITCNSRGQWEPSPPKCTATCRIPEIANVQLSDLKMVLLHDDVLVIKCEQGYDLSGSSTIKCSSQGQWEPSLPECIETHKGLSTGAIAGIIIGCLIAAVAVGLLYLWFSKKKTGEYYCEHKNDLFKQTVEQELTESNNTNRKPKSDTPDVQYTACNDA